MRQVRPLWQPQNADPAPSKCHHVYRCYQAKHLPWSSLLFSLRARLFCNRAVAKTALFSGKRPCRAASRGRKSGFKWRRRKRSQTVVLCYSFLRTVQGSVKNTLTGRVLGPRGGLMPGGDQNPEEQQKVEGTAVPFCVSVP